MAELRHHAISLAALNPNKPMNNKRTAFFISDRTGITAENLGHSLLSQFEGIEFKRVRLPFLDSPEKARAAAVQINQASMADGQRPLVFSTLILPAVRGIIEQSDALILDLFEMFIVPMEAELGQPVAAETPHHLGGAFLALNRLAEANSAQMARLAGFGRIPIAQLPLADRDVSDLEALGQLARWLRGGQG